MCADIKFYIFMLFFIEIAIIISVIDVFIDRQKLKGRIMKIKNIEEFDVYKLINKVNEYCQENKNVSDVQFVCNDGLYTAFLKIDEVE